MPYIGPPVTGAYLDLLAWIHQHSRPRTYVEIGMRYGTSLALARPESLVIGIDPTPTIWAKVNADAGLYFETSDDFFMHRDVRALLQGLPIDLAFIDGMHLFEYALRDFRNIEKNAASESVVLVHDCLPLDAAMATRERQTSMWTGDTWKLVCCLEEMRPDLDISVVAVKSSGLAIIRNLDPTNRVLESRYDEAVERFQPLSYDFIDGRHAEALHLIPNDRELLAGLIPPWPSLVGRESPPRQRYPRALPVLKYRAARVVRSTAKRALARSGS